MVNPNVEVEDGPIDKEEEVQFKKFLDAIKQLYINITLAEALEQMSNYVKFMKDIVSKKNETWRVQDCNIDEGVQCILIE
ncbi:Retrovirus-related Pol polyprotein from transposon 17.6 [Gossypium australe]|uniref:Retrovirus-related Pol polyprotein from transposon 17.6 n=1 Tax=Gossypium australe TaxID=47621 RepID=A0A5B6VLV2_9ROSI|nr:Retrovirus-related Pol polyprotein from transposon 17.6 [Gossypium australe]